MRTRTRHNWTWDVPRWNGSVEMFPEQNILFVQNILSRKTLIIPGIVTQSQLSWRYPEVHLGMSAPRLTMNMLPVTAGAEINTDVKHST